MAILLSILGSIGSFIGSILKAIPPIVWLCIACVFVGMLITSKGCSCRQQTIRENRKERLDAKIHSVISVVNGATIEIESGVFGRRSRYVQLKGISCPSEGQPFFDESRENLESTCGEFCRVTSDCVFGASGINLNIEQLEMGFAKCNSDAPDEWLKIEAKAKKKKLGIWSR